MAEFIVHIYCGAVLFEFLWGTIVIYLVLKRFLKPVALSKNEFAGFGTPTIWNSLFVSFCKAVLAAASYDNEPNHVAIIICLNPQYYSWNCLEMPDKSAAMCA